MSHLSLTDIRNKALQIIRVELNYDAAIPGHQSDAFNWATQEAIVCGDNEYDAAIAFMLVQLGLLTHPLKGEVRSFYDSMSQKLKQIATKSVSSTELLRHVLKSQSLADPIGASNTIGLTSKNQSETLVQSVESRLLTLKKLKEKGLITQEQYDLKSEEIIREI